MYLVNYENIDLSIDDLNMELAGICKWHEELMRIFKDNCDKETIYTSWFKMEFEEKENKRQKYLIDKEDYKERYE
jgi:hypothetical protein